MKKILSLLLVLSLLLSMSLVATAATSGQLVDGDNEIELPWDTDEASVYTYTATQTGTLYISTIAFGYAEESYNYEDNMEKLEDEWGWYTRLTVDGQLLDGLYFGTVEVVEGQTYTFSWSHAEDVVLATWYDMGWNAVLNLSYDGELVPKLGSEKLPVELLREDCPTQTIEIAPGTAVYYQLKGFGGTCFTVTGENAYVLVTYFDMLQGEQIVDRIDPVNGVVTIPIEFDLASLQIGNDGAQSATFSLDCYYPLGCWHNPAQLVGGKNVATTIEENFDGYYFTWTAQCNGTLTLTFPEAGWTYSVLNTGDDLGERFFSYESEEALNPIELTVSKGDVIILNVNSFDANTYTVPGGEVVVTASIKFDHKFVNGVCKTCGQEEVTYQLGDVNGDGRVNTRDARALLLYVAGILTEDDMILEVADVTGDQRVNVRDARQLLLWAVGL